MPRVAKSYSFHLVGLGGAGTNIVETFLKDPKVLRYLETRGVKLTCLAFDVADHDIMSLQQTYDWFKEEMKDRGITADRVNLNAHTIKFTTPQSMFDFIQKFPEFLSLEGGKVPTNYQPWLTSSVEIPPLAGGVGRRRALSKAIYGLNYHALKLLDTYIENFKIGVSSSVVQPIIFVIFGIGGGSGSGMAVDFVRHLRQKIGTGFPIIGIGVLPCSGDDRRAKGNSCYAAINELTLLIDDGYNKIIRETYGKSYENPFTAFIMMPLAPTYRKVGNLADAQKFFDEAVVDVILNTLRFDMAEMLDGIGANLAYDEKCIHLMTTLRVTYPVMEYIELTKHYLDTLVYIRRWKQERSEMLLGSKEKGFGGIELLLSRLYAELAAIYKQIQIEENTYDPAQIEKKLQKFVHGDKSVEFNIKSQIRGIADIVREYVDEVGKPVKSIALGVKEASHEARFKKTISQIIERTRNVADNYQTYHDDVSKLLDEMNKNAPAIQKLTYREKNLLKDFTEVIPFIEGYMRLTVKCVEVKVLSDKLITELSTGSIKEWKKELISAVQEIVNVELKFILGTLSSPFAPAKAELTTMESQYHTIAAICKTLRKQLSEATTARDELSSEVQKMTNEMDVSTKQANSFFVKVFTPNRKKRLDEALTGLRERIDNKKQLLRDKEARVTRLQERLREYEISEKKVDVDSSYRKLVQDIYNAENVYYDKLSGITRERGYYDHVVDMTEDERLRIMKKVLREEDISKREHILNEIVDIRRFREYLTGTIRVLQIPGTIGVESTYRTNFIWATVIAPKDIWNQDLDAELKATLSSFLVGGTTRNVHVAHVESADPWTIRVLLIASKAAKEDLDVYAEMRALYEQSSKSDKLLAHSLLLEQGILVSEAMAGKKLVATPVICPVCKAEVNLVPIKEWDMAPKKKGRGPKLHVELYEHCGKKFRVTKKV